MSIEAYKLFICKHRCEEHEVHTHLDMFNGKYCIKTTNDDHKKFLILRAAALNAGHKDCITEIATPEHIYHADIDGSVDQSIEFDYMGIARAIQRTLQLQTEIHKSDTSIIILTAPPDVKEDGKIKHGMHIIAPYIKCSFEYEKNIRLHSFEHIQPILDEMSPHNKLLANEIFDISPYTGSTGSGLRMAFSYKTDKLPDGTKKLVDRRYTVYAVLKPDGFST